MFGSARLVTITGVLVAAIAISGCSGVIHKRINTDNGKGLSLGARQRVILVTKYGGKDKDRKIVCAEPSPDVFAVRAASAAASMQGVLGGTSQEGQKQAASQGFGFGFASSETAATISRTQTINLLRDGLYRLCEAYMNGAVNETQYNVALVNMDKLMTSLLAIDTIGGTPVPPLVGITAGKATANAPGGAPPQPPPAPGAQPPTPAPGAQPPTPAAANVAVTAGDGAKVTISKDIFRGKLDKEAHESIKAIALAHHGVGDKLAKFVAICAGIQNRGDLRQGYGPHDDLRRNCDRFEKLMSNPDILAGLLRREHFEPYYGEK